MGRTTRGVAAILLAVTASAVLGCAGLPDGRPAPSPSVTDGPTTPGPPVPRLMVPATVPCPPGQERAPVALTYTTQDAVGVAIRVDGLALEAQPPTSGTYEVSVPCDGASHTITLDAFSAGLGVSRTEATVRTSPA